jgi:hypothetical protein
LFIVLIIYKPVYAQPGKGKNGVLSILSKNLPGQCKLKHIKCGILPEGQNSKMPAVYLNRQLGTNKRGYMSKLTCKQLINIVAFAMQ